MLIGHVAIADFTLHLCTQERGFSQDHAAKQSLVLTCHNGRSHTAHGVPYQNRGRKTQSPNKTNDVVRVVQQRPFAVSPCSRIIGSAFPSVLVHSCRVFKTNRQTSRCSSSWAGFLTRLVITTSSLSNFFAPFPA